MLDSYVHFFQITTGLDVELFRITFIASLIISLMVTFKRENVPLGIIVPGTILLLLGFPLKLLLVLSISLLVFITSYILQKFIFPKTIFAAKEKLIIAVFLSIVYSSISYIFFNFSLEVLTAGAIGIVVPAMIADSLEKKHWKQSLVSFGITLLWTILFFIIIKLLTTHLATTEYKEYLNYLYPIDQEMNSASVLVMYIIFAVTAILNFVFYRTRKVHATGLLLGAYLGILIYQPSQIAFVLFVIGIAYAIMTAVYKYTMIFGYRVFVIATLIVSVVYSFAEQLAYYLSNGNFHAFIGLHFAGLIVCGILVSEMVQHGHKKIIVGSSFMTIMLACTLATIQTTSTYFHYGFTINDLLNKSENASKLQVAYSPLLTQSIVPLEALKSSSFTSCHPEKVVAQPTPNTNQQTNTYSPTNIPQFTCE